MGDFRIVVSERKKACRTDGAGSCKIGFERDGKEREKTHNFQIYL